MWGDKVPWASGEPGAPKGNFCEASVETFTVGGFQATHKPISKYLAWSAQNPEKKHSEFLSAQAAYISVKNNDPTGRVGSKKLRSAIVTIENEEEDVISDKDMDFVTLSALQEERKEFRDPKTGKLPHPSDYKIELKFRKTRKHPTGVWGGVRASWQGWTSQSSSTADVPSEATACLARPR